MKGKKGNDYSCYSWQKPEKSQEQIDYKARVRDEQEAYQWLDGTTPSGRLWPNDD